MKKVLILAYDFPPYISVGGLRPYSWYKYLKEFGFYPIVVTRQWDNKYGNHLDYISKSNSKETIIENTDYGTIIQTPYRPNLSNRLFLKYGNTRFKIIRKLITAYYEFAQYLFTIGPKSGLFYGAQSFLAQEKVDFIIATGEPFVLFKYASKLSEKYHIPWIADYRDPWSQSKNRSSNFILRIWNSYFEKKFLSNAKTITTVSDFLRVIISEKIHEKGIKILPNGFDGDFKPSMIKNDNTKWLEISFAGTIYKWHPWQSFLKVCIQTNLPIKINFYGINIQNEIEEFVATQDTKHLKTEFNPKIPNDSLLNKLNESHILLLFNDYQIMGTKIYDYLACNRLIILCYIDDPKAQNLKMQFYPINKVITNSIENLQEKLLLETNAGLPIIDEQHLQSILVKLISDFKKEGYIEIKSTGIEKYSRKHQVLVLSEILKGIDNSNIDKA